MTQPDQAQPDPTQPDPTQPDAAPDGTLSDITTALDNTPQVEPTVTNNNIDIPDTTGEPVGIGDSLTIDLPLRRKADDPVNTDGITIFNDNTRAVAVNPTSDGVQLLVTITDPTAPTQYQYPMDNNGQPVTITTNDQGGATITDTTGDFIASIAPPWATDANGKPVPTHYEVNGTTLTQIINHTQDNYTYPITADPYFSNSCGWTGCTLYLSRSFTKSLSGQLGRYANSSMAAIALAFAATSAPAGGIGAIACAGMGAIQGAYAIDQIIYAGKHNQCVGIWYFYLPSTASGITPYNGGNCKN